VFWFSSYRAKEVKLDEQRGLCFLDLVETVIGVG
jgi:hypothetical protein